MMYKSGRKELTCKSLQQLADTIVIGVQSRREFFMYCHGVEPIQLVQRILCDSAARRGLHTDLHHQHHHSHISTPHNASTTTFQQEEDEEPPRNLCVTRAMAVMGSRMRSTGRMPLATKSALVLHDERLKRPTHRALFSSSTTNTQTHIHAYTHVYIYSRTRAQKYTQTQICTHIWIEKDTCVCTDTPPHTH